jgi:hypothetical protein
MGKNGLLRHHGVLIIIHDLRKWWTEYRVTIIDENLWDPIIDFIQIIKILADSVFDILDKRFKTHAIWPTNSLTGVSKG